MSLVNFCFDASSFPELALMRFIPEIFLANALLIVLIHASTLTASRIPGEPLLMQSYVRLCILVTAITLFLTVTDPSLSSVGAGFTPFLAYQKTFVFDPLANSAKQFMLIGFLFTLVISEKVLLRAQINAFEYLILMLSAVLGLLFLVSANDFISLYLALEMQSLCLYVLAASKKNSSFSLEAGLKYFILGSFSSALFLFGVGLVYGCTGTTNFFNLYLLFNEVGPNSFVLSPTLERAWICVVVAFFFKIAAAPFHMWAPDVYEGSPTSSTIFFTVVPKLGMFVVFLRIIQPNFGAFEDIFIFLFSVSAVCSVFFGSFLALQQKKLKRLLAFSAIGHVGYLLLAVASNTIAGTQALFFYLVIYMITTVGAWALVVSLNSPQNTHRSKTLADLAQISRANPLFGFAVIIVFFSLAGIPPFAGFFAKMEIFLGALGASLYVSSVIAILISVVSSFYYIRLVKTVYVEKLQKNMFVYPVSEACATTLGLCVFALVFFALNPTLLLLVSHKMALCLHSL